MNLKSLIQFLFLINIWPGQISRDGCIKLNVFNIKSLILSCVYLVGAGLCVWRYSVLKLINQTEWNFIEIAMVILNSYPILQVFLAPVYSLALKSLDGWCLNSATESIDMSLKVCKVFFGNVIITIGLFLQMPAFLPHDDPIFWIAIIIIMVPFSIITFGLNMTPLVSIQMLNSELIEMKENLSSKKNVVEIIEKIERTSKAISVPLSQTLIMCQISMILCVYLIVTSTAYANLSLFLVNMIIIILMTMGDLEECYDLIKEIADKAREEACGKSSVKEMMQLMVAAGKLEDTYPFSAMKFFTFERSTVTAMLATTLTYLVVLIQSIPDPQGNGE